MKAAHRFKCDFEGVLSEEKEKYGYGDARIENTPLVRQQRVKKFSTGLEICESCVKTEALRGVMTPSPLG